MVLPTGQVDCAGPHPEAVPAEDVAEALARAPEDLIELHVCQLQRLSNRGPRLFMEVYRSNTSRSRLHGQLAHEFANVFRQLLNG